MGGEEELLLLLLVLVGNFAGYVGLKSWGATASACAKGIFELKGATCGLACRRFLGYGEAEEVEEDDA